MKGNIRETIFLRASDIEAKGLAIDLMKGIFCALLSALLLILSFLASDLELLAWIAMVPLLVVIRNGSLKSAAGLSFLAGICFFSGVFYWMVVYGVTAGFTLDFLALDIYLGLYFCIFGLVFNFVSKRTAFSAAATAPVLWVSLEYLRCHAGFLAIPCALLGHSQYLNLPLIQISSFTGAYGVSFLIVMVNAAISDVVSAYLSSRKPGAPGIMRLIQLKSIMVVLLGFSISLAYGLHVLSGKPEGEKISITVIQGNISQDIKWDSEFRKQILNKHVQLTRQASQDTNTSLIIWPETSIPGNLIQDFALFQTISNLARETKTHLLVGGAQNPKFGSREFKSKHLFNSAFLISPAGSIEKQYKKMHLLPFGEYLPYQDVFPWPERFVTATGISLIAGKDYTLFDLNGALFGVLICWENIFPDLCRTFVKKGAHFIVNMTNEAWFGKTQAPYQLMANSVFRAVENRVAIARSANTGISCFVSPFGEIMGKVKNNNKDIFVEGFLTMTVPLSCHKTFYTLYGDIFAYSILIMTIIMLVLSFIKIR